MKTLHNLLEKIGKLVNLLLGFLPTPLPVGATAFDQWASSIIKTYGAPRDIPDNDSVRQLLAVQIMHLKPDEATKPKRYFGRVMQKAAAAEVAHNFMVDVQEAKKRRMAEEAAQAKAAYQSEDEQQTVLINPS